MAVALKPSGVFGHPGNVEPHGNGTFPRVGTRAIGRHPESVRKLANGSDDHDGFGPGIRVMVSHLRNDVSLFPVLVIRLDCELSFLVSCLF